MVFSVRRFSDLAKTGNVIAVNIRRFVTRALSATVVALRVTKSSVRRERMGHIELAAPVSHIWYFKGIPSRMGLILDLSPRTLEKVLYFASYIVLDAGNTALQYKQVLSEGEYQDAREQYGNAFRVGMGAEAIQELITGD